MDDDFNTAQALSVLFELAREINRADVEGKDASPARKTLLELGGVLGLTLKEPERKRDVEPFVDLLITIRKELREAKQTSLLTASEKGYRIWASPWRIRRKGRSGSRDRFLCHHPK